MGSLPCTPISPLSAPSVSTGAGLAISFCSSGGATSPAATSAAGLVLSAGDSGSTAKLVSPNAMATLSISAGLITIDGMVDTPMHSCSGDACLGRSAPVLLSESLRPATTQYIIITNKNSYILNTHHPLLFDWALQYLRVA